MAWLKMFETCIPSPFGAYPTVSAQFLFAMTWYEIIPNIQRQIHEVNEQEQWDINWYFTNDRDHLMQYIQPHALDNCISF